MNNIIEIIKNEIKEIEKELHQDSLENLSIEKLKNKENIIKKHMKNIETYDFLVTKYIDNESDDYYFITYHTSDLYVCCEIQLDRIEERLKKINEEIPF